jgi:hypothetical protein
VVLIQSIKESFKDGNSSSSGQKPGNYASTHNILFAVSKRALKKGNSSHKLNVYSYLKVVSVQEKANLWEPVTQLFTEKVDILFPVIFNIREFVYYKDGCISV